MVVVGKIDVPCESLYKNMLANDEAMVQWCSSMKV